jgi:glycosyltransferase involved in cell wall biosynthesis
LSQSGAAAPELAVVVPVKNEAENVAPLVAEIEAALEGVVDYELIYVDDGSGDATAARLAEARAARPRLRVLRHARSCGQSTAIRSGVRAARAPLIATLDGDGQNDPADIPALLAVMRAAPDAARLLVTGQRLRRRDSWLKRISSRVANAVRGALLGDGTPDTGCGLKLFRRDAFLELPYFDHMHRFLPALMIRAGGRVVSVPVRHRPRERGRSNYGTLDRLWVGMIDLAGVAWLQRRARIAQAAEDEDVH